MVMSVKILQSEGKVVPISGKLCQACKDLYDAIYTSKPGEKIVIVMPREQLPMNSPLTIPSPFGGGPAMSPTNSHKQTKPMSLSSNQHLSDSSKVKTVNTQTQNLPSASYASSSAKIALKQKGKTVSVLQLCCKYT